MKNKVFSIAIVLIISIAIIGAVAGFVVLKLTKNDHSSVSTQPTIEEIVESTVDVDEIMTNLKDDRYIKISFKLQVDNVEGKTELDQRIFQVKDIAIKELAQLEAKELSGKEGIMQLENALKAKVNELMQNGTVIKVYTTSFILQ